MESTDKITGTRKGIDYCNHLIKRETSDRYSKASLNILIEEVLIETKGLTGQRCENNRILQLCNDKLRDMKVRRENQSTY